MKTHSETSPDMGSTTVSIEAEPDYLLKELQKLRDMNKNLSDQVDAIIMRQIILDIIVIVGITAILIMVS
jgi:hypothetical protein